nr:uncharacterized protein LOC113817596 [Penaeus vannamei]
MDRRLATYVNHGQAIIVGLDFPTLIRHNSTTTPDLVIKNRYGNFNTHLSQGKITTIDHLPVQAIISTSPIMIPKQPTKDYKKADWEKYKEHLSNTRTIQLHNKPCTEIDKAVEQCEKEILAAKEDCIPNKVFTTIPHHKSNHHLNVLKNLYQEIIRRRKDPKIFWNKIRRLKGNDTPTSPYLLNPQNERIYEEVEKEKLHNTFWSKAFKISDEENLDFVDQFENVIRRDFARFPRKLVPYQTINLGMLNDNNPLTAKITQAEVKEVISKMKDKAPENFRPISLLEIPRKVLERIVNSRLMTFLENNILNTNQYGFRRGKGTATPIAIAYEQIGQDLAQNHQCNIIMRDVSKAFDKMPEPITKLLCNFLDGRRAYIKIGTHAGNPINLKSGVPQGSTNNRISSCASDHSFKHKNA